MYLRNGQRILSPMKAAVQARKLHVAAAGALTRFNDPEEIKRLTAVEPTMISTLETHKEALRLNPGLTETIASLRAHGHEVAFGVDATQLHSAVHPPVQEMYRAARKKRIDMSKMAVDFLRSGSEKRADDIALWHGVAGSAVASGVRALTATHTADRFNKSKYHAPSSAEIVPAVVAAGFSHKETTEERRARTVESVVRTDGTMQTVRINTAGVSVFNRE